MHGIQLFRRHVSGNELGKSEMGTGTFNNVCVCEIFSCSKNVNRGNVARRKYIETKGWKIAEENTISLIHKIQA